MRIKIPNLKEILKPRWAHKPGFGMRGGCKLIKREGSEQATTPEDPKLLDKLGIKKKEKVLAIAAYYASWASQIAKAGAKVDYNDISKEMVNYAKRRYGRLFGEYICSNYESTPENPEEYDWTFTFEACGGGSGLPIAYLRALTNNKGGILVLFLDREKKENMGSKPKRYPLIVNTLSEIYGCKSGIKEEIFRGHRIGGERSILRHRVYTIRTNNSARKKADLDLRVLDYAGGKRIINLENEAENLSINKKQLEDSFIRLSKLSKIISREFVKTIKVR